MRQAIEFKICRQSLIHFALTFNGVIKFCCQLLKGDNAICWINHYPANKY